MKDLLQQFVINFLGFCLLAVFIGLVLFVFARPYFVRFVRNAKKQLLRMFLSSITILAVISLVFVLILRLKGCGEGGRGNTKGNDSSSSMSGSASGGGSLGGGYAQIDVLVELNGTSPNTYAANIIAGDQNVVFSVQDPKYKGKVIAAIKTINGVDQNQINKITLETSRSIPAAARLQTIQLIEWATGLDVEEARKEQR